MMTTNQLRLNSSRGVIHCGIILSAVGLYLRPVWSPLFGIGFALTWLGVLQNSLECMFVKGNRIAWAQFVMVAVLLTVVLYIVTEAILNYGHSPTQRIVIATATIALQASIVLMYKKLHVPTVASYDLIATGPKHHEP